MAPPYVLIDNCALNWIYTGYGGREFSPAQVDRALANLDRAADEDRVRVFFNQHLLEEVSGCWHNPTIRWKVPVLLGALSRLAKNRWLRLPVRVKEHPNEAGRHEREARCRGPISESERFIEPYRVARLWSPSWPTSRT